MTVIVILACLVVVWFLARIVLNYLFPTDTD